MILMKAYICSSSHIQLLSTLTTIHPTRPSKSVMLIAILTFVLALAAHALAQCDRAADCAAADPWFYQCTDGTRADYTDCANACCAEMNAAICSDPVQSFDYDGCMDACSASAAARCGKSTTNPPTTSSPSASTTTTTSSSSSSSSPPACLDSRAPAGGGQCINSLLQSCRTCHRAKSLQSNGKPITVNGCGRQQDDALRQIQESRYPKMTSVCKAHDRCFGTCQAGFKACNDALVAGAYGVCDEMAREREQWCLDVMGMSKKECQEERAVLYSNCVGGRGELVYVTKAAVRDPEMCEAFNDAQREFCKCAK